MKGIVIYTSRYGSTRQYAEWIASELKLPVIETKNAGIIEISKYDFIIAGSPVYFSKMLIRKWLKQFRKSLQQKKIYLFVVSGTPDDESALQQEYIHKSVPNELLNALKIYFLPGRLHLKSLDFYYRWILYLGSKLMKDPQIRTKIITEFDLVNKEHIQALINDVKKLQFQESHFQEFSNNN